MASDAFFKLELPNQYGQVKKVSIHGYLFGLLVSLVLKKQNNRHAMLLVTGEVGDGKSSLIEGLAAIECWMNKKVLTYKNVIEYLTFDNISWRTEAFIEKTDRGDNLYSPLIWDESIQGINAKNMANSKIGFKLKSAFVTKRFKKHTYYLLVDGVEEYAWKVVKMVDAWIHVVAFGFKRGYFNVYVNKSKIEFLYNAFKIYKKSWRSPAVKKIKPDCKGTAMNFGGLFLEEGEYNKRKLEETRQIEAENDGKGKKSSDEKDSESKWSMDKIKVYGFYATGVTSPTRLHEMSGVSKRTIENWKKDFLNMEK